MPAVWSNLASAEGDQVYHQFEPDRKITNGSLIFFGKLIGPCPQGGIQAKGLSIHFYDPQVVLDQSKRIDGQNENIRKVVSRKPPPKFKTLPLLHPVFGEIAVVTKMSDVWIGARHSIESLNEVSGSEIPAELSDLVPYNLFSANGELLDLIIFAPQHYTVETLSNGLRKLAQNARVTDAPLLWASWQPREMSFYENRTCLNHVLNYGTFPRRTTEKNRFYLLEESRLDPTAHGSSGSFVWTIPSSGDFDHKWQFDGIIQCRKLANKDGPGGTRVLSRLELALATPVATEHRQIRSGQRKNVPDCIEISKRKGGGE